MSGQAPQRILVYGCTGAGKSHAAQRIAALLELPYVSVDDHTWLPGWELKGPERQRADLAGILGADRWVIDAAYRTWLDLALDRVDLIVGLDHPRLLSLSRLIRRTGRRLVTREPVCNGNRETLRQLFARDSIIAWHFRSWARKRRTMRAWAADPQGPPIVVLGHPRELERWLDGLPGVRQADR